MSRAGGSLLAPVLIVITAVCRPFTRLLSIAVTIFGKLLNSASEKVILELLRTKCTPILLYGLECLCSLSSGLECFQLGKADVHSLDFTFNRLCINLFKTVSIEVVRDCQSYFAIDLPSCDLKRRQDKFIIRYISTGNGFCQYCYKL